MVFSITCVCDPIPGKDAIQLLNKNQSQLLES